MQEVYIVFLSCVSPNLFMILDAETKIMLKINQLLLEDRENK